MDTRNKYEMKKLVQKIGKCELCGSKRFLDAHHIIPISCGGPDTEENLLVVCRVCHTKLTPTSLLTKCGINRRKELNKQIQIYDIISLRFYQKLKDFIETEETTPRYEEILDMFDGVIKKTMSEDLK